MYLFLSFLPLCDLRTQLPSDISLTLMEVPEEGWAWLFPRDTVGEGAHPSPWWEGSEKGSK